ncbi:hypothetical protein D9M72_581020 [compost metagenome]
MTRGIICDDNDLFHPFGFRQFDNPLDAKVSIVWLTACHRDVSVKEHLVGHTRTCSHCLTQRQAARVMKRSVSDVDENVLLVRKRCLADPEHPLGPHMRVRACRLGT